VVLGVDANLSESRGNGVLGIPVALETVSRMGGHVTVGSEPGQPGSIQFTVRLGISTDEVQPRPVVDVQPPLENPILIIADSLDDRRSIVKTLGESGLPYVVNSSVEEWVAARQTNGNAAVVPSLAIIASTDDSFSSCDRFRAFAADVPVIVIASTGRRGDAARCREHGVRGYLAQPMDPGDLVDAVKATTALVDAGDTSTLVTRHWLRDGRRSLHVLVVDDSPTSRFLMTRMLDQRGHSTESACDGAEAVGAFERDKFDVVLMDIMMPGIDGLEATRLIRAKDAGSIQRPLVIGVSAFTDQTNTDRGRDAGMDAMLDKPLRPDDLFALIEQQTPVDSRQTA
jgi:CheY-like chemotaxis protein